MQRESEKQPTGTGPLAEIEFWRERNAVLSALFEQLNLTHVKRMIQVRAQFEITWNQSECQC